MDDITESVQKPQEGSRRDFKRDCIEGAREAIYFSGASSAAIFIIKAFGASIKLGSTLAFGLTTGPVMFLGTYAVGNLAIALLNRAFPELKYKKGIGYYAGLITSTVVNYFALHALGFVLSPLLYLSLLGATVLLQCLIHKAMEYIQKRSQSKKSQSVELL